MYFKQVNVECTSNGGFDVVQTEVICDRQSVKNFHIRGEKLLKEYLKRAHADEVYIGGLKTVVL